MVTKKPVDFPAARTDFPALADDPAALAYLDSASTALLPEVVIEAMAAAQRQGLGNPGRGVHPWAERATAGLQQARSAVQRFIGAAEPGEVIFTGGTTEALNLVAFGYALPLLTPSDEVVVSELEHHANLLPWQQVCARSGARLRVVRLRADHEVDLEAVTRVLSARTRIVTLAHVSNVLGCALPIAAIAERVHAAGAVLCVDGAQAAAHRAIDVRALGCDFYAFSGHKLYGPTGIGVLWGHAALLEQVVPLRWGGGMIRRVTIDGHVPAKLPARLEAGTPNVVAALGLARALDYLSGHDRETLMNDEQRLLSWARHGLEQRPGIRILSPKQCTGLLSFIVEGVHAHDVGSVAASRGVAVRAGHHCAQPLMQRLGVAACVRMSLGLYNGAADIEALLTAVDTAQTLFS